MAILALLYSSAMVPAIPPDLFKGWTDACIRVITAPPAFLEAQFAFDIHTFSFYMLDVFIAHFVLPSVLYTEHTKLLVLVFNC